VPLERTDRTLGVQVIFERREDILGRRVALDGAKPASA
jgi:hypothetical protein